MRSTKEGRQSWIMGWKSGRSCKQDCHAFAEGSNWFKVQALDQPLHEYCCPQCRPPSSQGILMHFLSPGKPSTRNCFRNQSKHCNEHCNQYWRSMLCVCACVNPALQSNGNKDTRFQGSRVPFRFWVPCIGGAPVPDPEIETQHALLLEVLCIYGPAFQPPPPVTYFCGRVYTMHLQFAYHVTCSL